MADDGLVTLTASEAAAEIARGAVSAETYARACLARIEALDGEVRAFAHLDGEHVLAQARMLDERRMLGHPLGPLHGIPVAIKDIIDTADYPTELGSPLAAGRRPRHDATVVARLRAAGAVIVGKTVTTEFAYFHPGPTRNPHDYARTPGGSSSGSAAAVAAHMVPLALGSQTNGSVIRPAAFCGVFAVKPTHGLVSRAGVLQLSRKLDHVGAFARSLPDLALILDVLAGLRPRRPGHAAFRQRRFPRRAKRRVRRHPAAFRFRAHAGLGQGRGRNPGGVRGTGDGARFRGRADRPSRPVRRSLGHPAHHHGDRDGAQPCALRRARRAERGDGKAAGRGKADERGRVSRCARHRGALRRRPCGNLRPVRRHHHARGAGRRPAGLSATGDPAFCTMWTLTGLPALSLPLLAGESGLPIGVQLVGGPRRDARLLRTATALIQMLAPPKKRVRRPRAGA